MDRDVIIACDFSSKEALYGFLGKFGDIKPFLKVGMELFYKEGPGMVRELKEKGYKIFLDLKLHDIPNTVYRAMKNLASLGVDITNVHAAGGTEMMRCAKRGLEEGARGNLPLLISVTQLTSISEEILRKELLIGASLADTVKAYAQNTKEAGLDGCVCSPLEAPIIAGLGLLSVTPGIRMEGDGKDDQKRVTTPAMARELGSAYIVVGRSITGAADPAEAYTRCMKEFIG
ncbi:MAG: orotidine-5'-phosphate decarboxylase [Clostridiales bacterium]|nr:orotidine-5'-phosphate decarboxylase [Clostridiales bacterium]